MFRGGDSCPVQMGVLYSENKEVVSTLTKMVRTTSQASSDTMDKVGRLFRSPGFLEGYIAQHQASERTRKGLVVIRNRRVQRDKTTRAAELLSRKEALSAPVLF